MSTAINGRHARPGSRPEPVIRERRSRFGWPRRRAAAPASDAAVTPDAAPEAAPALPRGDHPYPPFAGTPASGQPLTALPFHPPGGDLDHVTEVPPFRPAETTADLLRPAGRPYLPDGDATAAQARRSLDGPPLAFTRRAPLRLTRRPVFLGLAPAGDGRQLAEIDFGGPEIYAWDRAGLDWLSLVIKQAREDLVYSQPVTPVRAPGTGAQDVLARAQAMPGPVEEHAAAGISEVAANLSQALDLYEEVRAGTIPPDWVSAGLAPGGRDAALKELARDVDENMNALVAATARYRGEEAAAYVAGREGESR